MAKQADPYTDPATGCSPRGHRSASPSTSKAKPPPSSVTWPLLITFAARAGELYADINVLHPLWEGNGRANCQFHTQLAAAAGWTLDWSKTSQDALDAAAVRGMNNPDQLAAIFWTALTGPPRPGSPAPAALIRRTAGPGDDPALQAARQRALAERYQTTPGPGPDRRQGRTPPGPGHC